MTLARFVRWSALAAALLVAAPAITATPATVAHGVRHHAAAVDLFVGSFTAPNGTTGAQAITGVGFQPKAVIIWTSGVQSGPTDQGFISLGWTDCTDESVTAGLALDNQFLWVADGTQSAADILRTTTSAGAVNREASFTSCDADGFTLNWDLNAAWSNTTNFIAIGGTSVTAKAGNITQPNAAGSQATSGIGLAPTIVFVRNGRQGTTATNSTGGGAEFHLGAMTATAQWSSHSRAPSNGSSTNGRQRTDAVIDLDDYNGSGGRDVCARTSLDADGWTLNCSDIDTGFEEPVFYLALGGVQAFIGAANAPTSNGTQALTSFGFQPALFCATGWNRVTMPNTNTISDTGSGGEINQSVGCSDGTRQRGMLWGPDFAVPSNSIRDQWSTDLYRNYTAAATGSSSTLTGAADLQTFDAGGVTLDWTTTNATAKEFLYFAFGGAAGGGGAGPKWFQNPIVFCCTPARLQEAFR